MNGTRMIDRVRRWGGCAVVILWGLGAVGLDEIRYQMRLEIDDASQRYAGEMTVSFRNSTEIPHAEVYFRLYPNADAIYAGELEISAVRVDGSAAVGETIVDDTIFVVELPSPLEPGSSVAIDLAFAGRTAGPPARSDYGILNRTDEAMTLTAFYPILAPYTAEGWVLDPVFAFGDAVTSEAASYVVDLMADPSLLLVTTGQEVASPEGGMRRFAIERAREFSVVLLDGAVQAETHAEGIRIRTSFRRESEAAAAAARRWAAGAIEWYSERIGALPFEEIDIVEVPLRGVAGVEFSGLILVSSEYARQPDDPFYSIIIAHEIAHQWFYGVVGNDVVEAPWLDEGLATFLTAAYLDAAGYSAEATRERERWRSRYTTVKSTHPELAITSPLYQIPDSPAYSALAYSGAALLLDAVCDWIGERAFFDGLSAYYQAMSFRLATPRDLWTALEEASGCHLGDLLREFEAE